LHPLVIAVVDERLQLDSCWRRHVLHLLVVVAAFVFLLVVLAGSIEGAVFLAGWKSCFSRIACRASCSQARPCIGTGGMGILTLFR
jgi:hypothetical protein